MLDFVGALFALLVLSPLMALLAVTILVVDGRPIIFSQKRPGKDARIFKLYKFRTMEVAPDSHAPQSELTAGATGGVAGGAEAFADNADAAASDAEIVASDAMRMTKLGAFLRKTSLDELPEFFNVLKGDMSFVGPRPLLVEYLKLYSEFQARRHEVRPGITGLAQVSGRNLLSWPERFKLDVEYVDSLSAALDLKIMLATIAVVFSRKGVSAEGEATMSPFKEES